MFEAVIKEGQLMGHRIELRRGFAFFGSRHFQKSDFLSQFPKFEFRNLKQVHSKIVIPAPEVPVEGDGHWTSSSHLALLIQTADCVPLMIETPKRIFALHAGWRGVEQNILGEAMKLLDEDELRDLTLAAGPHISRESFEVGQDVAQRLLASDPLRDTSVLIPHAHPQKAYVDLQKILLHQARAHVPSAHIQFLGTDTFTSNEHHSYRRNGANAGRLFSFIVSAADPA